MTNERINPVDLFTAEILLRPGGQLHTQPRAFDLTQADWRLTAFHARTDSDVHADHWEVHPDGQEVVSCLTGGMRLYLQPDQPGEPETRITLTPGTAAIVPRGRRHRIELDAPSDILSVTLPRGSRLEQLDGTGQAARHGSAARS